MAVLDTKYKSSFRGSTYIGKTIEEAVAACKNATNQPVEVFKVETESVGWFKKKTEIEKVDPPPQARPPDDDNFDD